MTERYRNIGAIGAFVAVMLALALLWWSLAAGPGLQEETAGEVEGVQPLADSGGSTSPVASSRREERRPGGDPASKEAESIDYLREQFGATITSKRTQIKALEKIVAYLMKTYPDDWQARLQALLAQAFPDLAAQLYAQFLNMTAYNEWLAAHRGELNVMSAADRRNALHEERFRFFGPDASEIWEESLRNERIYDAMDAINQAEGTSVDEKLSTYLGAINEAYGDSAPDFLERRQTELMTGFLTLPSVQDDLHAMSAEARARELGEVRAAMGLDGDALARWRELDAQRDQAWQAGEDYMVKRDEITRSWQGEEQSRRLDALRTQIFGAEAATIRQEEDAQFFRFGHRRVYGKE